MRKLCLIALTIVVFVAAMPAQTPHPVLLVLNKTANDMAVVDPASGKVVARVRTGIGPHEVAVVDGKLAVVSNYGAREPGNSLSLIDLATQKELKRVDLGALLRPHGLWAAAGKVYFTAEGNKLVGRLDPTSSALDLLMGTGQNITHMLVVTPDQRKIFTANIGSDSVTVLENLGGRIAWNITQIAVGQGPEGIDISPDGSEVWTAHSRGGGVSIIDVAASKVKQILDIPTKRSNRLKFTLDGKLVLVSDLDAGELVIIDAATRKEAKRVKLAGAPAGILLAPDGSRAYVALSQAGEVAVLDLKTLEVTGRIATGQGPDGMAWAQ